jgi:hypothetical protein
MRARMPRTRLRTTALLMEGGGAAFFAAGAAFFYFYLDRNSEAHNFLERQGKATLTPPDLLEYNAAKRDRDRLGTAALVASGVGAALAMGGALLFFLDGPSVQRVPAEGSGQARRQGGPAAVAPLFAPGFMGAGIHGHF